MTPKENTHLLDKSNHGTVRINVTDGKDVDRGLNRRDYEYFEARPLWIKIRLCLFWLFWAVFVAVIILFVFIYWCIIPSLCERNVEYSV